MRLKWEDRNTPTIFSEGWAKTKKMAKKKALSQMVNLLISQGFIHRGFK